MLRQGDTEVETHWRVQTPLELDYKHVVAENQDRLPIIEELMTTVITDTLRKTAKSYNKKRKLKSAKKVAKKAAKRMVHGDIDPWRKKCESYGFLMAKSMIIMNAELLKDRMKPKNIVKDIGRDHWDYANDRVIGTGRGWNWNV